MFRFLLILLMTAAVNASTHYIVVDLSKGMSKTEYNELGKLTYVQKKDGLYSNGDKVKLLAFKGNKNIKKSFIYYERDIKEKGYKKAKKKHLSFFKQIEKGLKKPKKSLVKANVVFVVDTSGSMVTKRGDLLRKVKNSMKSFIKNKSRSAEVSIITFDGKKRQKEHARSHIVAQNVTNKVQLYRIVDNIQVSKYDTFLGSGLKKVSHVLPVNSKLKNIVMIFTDGAEINDYDTAKAELEKLKKEDIEVKVVAVGGADVEMLKAFSTSNYVYNATSNDLQNIIKDVSTNSDELIVKLNNYFDTNDLRPGDSVLVYSTFINIDSISDFSLIPNLSSKDFYNELQMQNKKRNVRLDLGGASFYGRIIGNSSSEKVNNLKGFWKPFMTDSNAVLKYFDSAPLSYDEMK